MSPDEIKKQIAECKSQVVKIILDRLLHNSSVTATDIITSESEPNKLVEELTKHSTRRNGLRQFRKRSRRYNHSSDDDDSDYLNKSDLKRRKKNKKSSLGPRLLPDLDGRYKCDDCHRTYNSVKGVRAHQKKGCLGESVPTTNDQNETSNETTATVKTKRNPEFISCSLCSNKFKSKKRLEFHILEYHVMDKPFECSICFRTFLTEGLLNDHVQNLHEKKDYQCPYCPNETFDKSGLKIHIEAAHRGYHHHEHFKVGEATRHFCPLCNASFCSDSEFQQHLLMPKIKTDANSTECSVCSETLETPCLLNQHRRKKHSQKITEKFDPTANSTVDQAVIEDAKEIKFECLACPLVFSRRSDLNLHETSEKHRRWKCTLCSLLVQTKKGLQNHIESVHSDARPLKCTLCEKTYKLRREWKRHMYTHGNDKYVCKICPVNKIFGDLKSLRAHIASHHGGERPFKCHLCGKAWGTASDLRQHLLMHSQDRPFPCTFCQGTFKKLGEANRHMKLCQLRSQEERAKARKIREDCINYRNKLEKERVSGEKSGESTKTKAKTKTKTKTKQTPQPRTDKMKPNFIANDDGKNADFEKDPLALDGDCEMPDLDVETDPPRFELVPKQEAIAGTTVVTIRGRSFTMLY